MYVKPTDRHQYLHYLSAHAYLTKKSVVFRQALRISRLCSSENDFENHKKQMKSWVRKKEYPEDLISSEISKVKFSNLRLKSDDENHNMKGIPLVVTYDTLLKSLSAIIDKNLSILYMYKEVKKVFTPRPMVSFCSARKLNSYLVRAKLYPLERTVGSYKCKSKRCQVYSNITEADSLTFSNDQTNFKINHRFDCNERCLIHLITYNRCLKQYVGQTVDNFRHRWNNYKDNAKKFERG